MRDGGKESRGVGNVHGVRAGVRMRLRRVSIAQGNLGGQTQLYLISR